MNVSIYQTFKLQLVAISGLSKDALHIYAGLGVFFLTVLFWKKGRVEWKCLWPVIFLAVLNEVVDLRDSLVYYNRLPWAGSIHDVLNTLFWPTMITFGTWLMNRKGVSGK